MLDRLLHRSVVFNIDGDSYRMRAHRARAERVRKGWSSAQEDELARPVRGSSAWGLSLICYIPSVRRFLRHDGCIVGYSCCSTRVGVRWRSCLWSECVEADCPAVDASRRSHDGESRLSARDWDGCGVGYASGHERCGWQVEAACRQLSSGGVHSHGNLQIRKASPGDRLPHPALGGLPRASPRRRLPSRTWPALRRTSRTQPRARCSRLTATTCMETARSPPRHTPTRCITGWTATSWSRHGRK